MLLSERTAIITAIALKAGYTAAFTQDPERGWVIRVTNTDGWYMEFDRADALVWARAVYQAHG